MRELRKRQRDELTKLRAFRSAHSSLWADWLARQCGDADASKISDAASRNSATRIAAQ
jgi:hypothetical protein